MKVTIITPTYKRDERILRRCIESVLGQSYKDVEHIIISDTSNAEEHVEHLIADIKKNNPDYSVKYFYNILRDDIGNTWGAIARNIGIENASKDSKYIMFLDDDNILFSHAIRVLMDNAKLYPEKSALICNIYHHGPLYGPSHPYFEKGIDGFQVPAHLNRLAYVLTGLPAQVTYIDSLNVFIKTSVMKECKWVVNYEYVNDGQTMQKLFSEYIKDNYLQVPEILGSHL